MTKLLQWNINAIQDQFEYHQQIIAQQQPELICLQETNLKENQRIRLMNDTSLNKIRIDCLTASVEFPYMYI